MFALPRRVSSLHRPRPRQDKDNRIHLNSEALSAFGVVAVLHVLGFGTVILFVIPNKVSVGSQIFGLGLAFTAYILGLRHAFDPDHIAAIDNSTRTIIRKSGKRPKTIGMWFSLGHSTVVLGLSVLIAWGAHIAATLADQNSSIHQDMGIFGTIVSGAFLILLGIINVFALLGIIHVFNKMRHGSHSEEELDYILENRGFFARILNPLIKRIAKPWHIYPIGFLFGLGFDTASEIALLVLAGTGAASGIPWYAILSLPVIFSAGMCLMDTADGVFMGAAYDWAFAKPSRKIFYNMVVTSLSVAIALFIGFVEIIQVAHDNYGLRAPILNQIAAINIDQIGYVIVGLFLVTWISAITVWKVGKFETRWDSPEGTGLSATHSSASLAASEDATKTAD